MPVHTAIFETSADDGDSRFQPIQYLTPHAVGLDYGTVRTPNGRETLLSITRSVMFVLPNGRNTTLRFDGAWTERDPDNERLVVRWGQPVPLGVVVEEAERRGFMPCGPMAWGHPEFYICKWRWWDEGEFYTYHKRRFGWWKAEERYVVGHDCEHSQRFRAELPEEQASMVVRVGCDDAN